jgi:sugar lactone lactonase YvrE
VVLVMSACSSVEPGAAQPTPTTTSKTVTTTTAIETTTTASAGPTTSLVPTLHSTVRTIARDIEGATGGVEVGPDGEIYVGDFDGSRIYRVTADGGVEVFVENELIQGAAGNTLASDGYLYQSSFRNGKVVRIGLEGSVQEFSGEGLNGPAGIVEDGAGGFFVADCDLRRVMHLDPEGKVTEFARHPDFHCPNGLTRDEAGNLYMSNHGDGWVFKIDPQGAAQRFVVLRGNNNSHITYAGDRLYASARGAGLIYAIDLDGTLTIVAGTGERGMKDGPGTEASFNLPNDIDIGPDGRLYLNQSSAEVAVNTPVALRMIDLSGD